MALLPGSHIPTILIRGGLEDMRLGRHQPGTNNNNGVEKILKVYAEFGFTSPVNAQVKYRKFLGFSRL